MDCELHVLDEVTSRKNLACIFFVGELAAPVRRREVDVLAIRVAKGEDGGGCDWTISGDEAIGEGLEFGASYHDERVLSCDCVYDFWIRGAKR